MQLEGKCACGNVTFEVDGEPRVQLYCHCRSCQLAHAAPMIAVALFKAEAVKYAGETRKVKVTGREDGAVRIICPRCGTKVLNEPHPKLRAVLPALCGTRGWFKPQMHIHWRDRSADFRDDLRKFLDLPKEMGGSGEEG